MALATTLANVHELPHDKAERELRVQLAAAYRLVDYFGWTELIFGHLTARVPGSAGHFLINPFGLSYDEVTASNLVKIDTEGNIIGDSDYPVSRAGFVIHSAVHMVPGTQNHVVMHTHTRAGMAIAATEEGLLPISMVSTGFFGNLAYHDYEGVSLYDDERERLVASMGEHKAMILRNHGLLTVGGTVPEAFIRLHRLERACQIQVDAGSAGQLRVLADPVASKSRQDMDDFTKSGPDARPGALAFAALMRKLDRIDPSYRD
jgi:ribulose-5-phosphate 4-epimerase/fuculose-1-phosphate aldolase